MTIQEQIQEVSWDKQNEVIEGLMRNNQEYQELDKLIMRIDEALRSKGPDIAELLSRREEATAQQNSITENALYMTGLKDGIVWERG
jgi:hypothetical protein